MRVVLYRGRWYAYWRDAAGAPRRRALRASSRDAAERALADLQRKPVGNLVANIFGAFTADKDRWRAEHAWKRLGQTFGHLRPDQIDRPLCRSYAVQRRAAGASDGTIIKELATLRAALRWHDKHTPATFELPASPPPMDRYLTREQYRAFREASKQTPHLHLFVVLAYTTAGRASAVLELTWDRIDFERGAIRLGLGDRRRKGRATPPIHPSALQLLTDAKAAALTPYVVEYGGRRVLKVRTAFDAAAARAGLPWCTPHVLRHSAAVHMAEGGVPMEEISQYLGHSSTAITERVYARFSPSYLRRAGSALE